MKSRVTVASGAITRSTDECEMSRSCQSATSSSALNPPPRTLQFVGPHRQLPAKSRRLGMDAVRSADARRVLELEGALPHRVARLVDAGEDQVGRVAQQKSQRSVEHIRAGHAEV